MKKTLITIGFLLGSVATVPAADIITAAPVAVPPAYEAAPLWTGLYIGGQIGWSRGKQPPRLKPSSPENRENEACELGDFAWAAAGTTNTSAIAWADPCEAWALGVTPGTESEAGTGSTPGGSEAGGKAGDAISYNSGGHRNAFIGGVHIGYNNQLENNFVVGAVADINFMNWGRYVGASYDKNSLEARQSMKYFATARAKLGYAQDRIFFYGTGGLALGSLKNEVLINNATTYSERKTRFGYTVGAGVDFLVTDNLSLGAEYLFTDFGKKSNRDVFSDKAQFHSIFVKASYHFN